MADDDDSVQIDYDDELKYLRLVCGPSSFARMKSVIQQNVPSEELRDIPLNTVSFISINDVNSLADASKPLPWWTLQMFKFGCGLIALAAMFILTAGVLSLFGIIKSWR